MASGKFSTPRPHRDEERQIEEAFRQVTEQTSAPRRTRRTEGTSIEYTPRPPEPAAREIPVEEAFSATPLPEEPVPDILSQTPVWASEPVRTPAGNLEETVLQPPVPPAPQAPRRSRFDRISQEMERLMEEELPQEPVEPEEPAEPDWIDKLMAFWDNRQGFSGGQTKVILVGFCAIALVLIVGFMAVLLRSTADPYGSKILDNVMAAGVNLGGMTKNQATSALKDAAKVYSEQDMVIDFSGSQLRLTPKEVNPKLDVKSLVNKAYDHGRDGTNAQNALAFEASRTEPHIIDITPYLSLNERYIKTTLESYAQEAGATLTQPSYGLEGEQPELAADKFNDRAPTQVLIITLGTPGIGFDPEAVYTQVLEAYRAPSFLVTVEQTQDQQNPEEVDLDAIYKEFYIEPVEATVDTLTNQTIPGSYGYEFDLEAAKKLLAEAEFGDVLRLPMIYIAPELLDETAFFQDTLGQHQTRHNSQSNRNTNLDLACKALDGTVVAPGASFSFNNVVGSRSAARGYQMAWSDSTEYATEYVGGGVSQVASTLFAAALTADLEIQTRNAGRYAPAYVEMGLDAEVGSSQDLTFRNSHTYPIRIQAQMSGGSVKIQILGTETRSHYVLLEQAVTQTNKPGTQYQDFQPDNPEAWEDGDVVQEGITGYSVQVYKVKHDLETNRQLSRDRAFTVNYRSEDQIIARVEIEETTVPTVPPTTVPPATVPPTTVPETTVPPTTQPTVPSTEPPATQAQELPPEGENPLEQQEDQAA